MNDKQRHIVEKWMDGESPLSTRQMVEEVLAASTPALPGEVRLPSEEVNTIVANVIQQWSDERKFPSLWPVDLATDTAHAILARVRELNPTPEDAPKESKGVNEKELVAPSPDVRGGGPITHPPLMAERLPDDACEHCGKGRATICEGCASTVRLTPTPQASTPEEVAEEWRERCGVIINVQANYGGWLTKDAWDGLLPLLAGASRRRVTDERVKEVEAETWAEFAKHRQGGVTVDLRSYARKVGLAVREECEGSGKG